MNIKVQSTNTASQHSQIDPISLSIIWNKIQSIAEEMGVTLRRTAYSDAVREGDDFATGLFDRSGRLIAQGNFAVGHSGSMLDLIQNLRKYISFEDLKPGDSVTFNDSALGSGHLPDIYIITPIFHNREIIGFTGVSAHHVDVGGAAPGSQQVHGITEIYQEGLRILPVRLFREGKVDDDMLRLILGNVRLPDQVWGDLQAQRNASFVGSKRFTELFEEYGVALDVAIDGILDAAEMRMRDAARTLRDGVYEFEDFLDDAGPGSDPVKFHVHVTVADGEIDIDFSGSSDQVAAAINSYSNFTRAWGTFSAMILSGVRTPLNAGAARAIKVRSRLGSYFNPRHPGPSAGRAAIQIRIFEVINGALSESTPERAMAGFSHWSNPNISGADPKSGRQFVKYDLIFGGYGGQYNKDGEEGLSPVMNCSNIPVEVYERNGPMRVRRFGFIQDSCGAGRFRGGCGVRKDIEIQSDGAAITLLGDRHKFQPYGLFGGYPGSLASTTLWRGDNPIPLSSKESKSLEKGDVISFQLAGGGGYGDPKQRSREAVEIDVVDGYISVEKAMQVYGFRSRPPDNT